MHRDNYELDRLGYDNYYRHFNNLLHIEEIQANRNIKSYTMEDAVMYRAPNSKLLRLEVFV